MLLWGGEGIMYETGGALGKGERIFIIIRFTSKARPYFLPTSEDDKTADIQKVKLADEDLVEITGIKPGIDERSVTAELTTEYKNVTPFSVLTPINFKARPVHKAYFTLYDDGWRLEKKR